MKELLRDNIKNLTAYKVDSPQYEIIVNANESAYDFPMTLKRQFCDEICNTHLNRYPQACFPELLTELSAYTGLPTDHIIAGSGSDELIAMINQCFVNSGDTVISHAPTFVMYNIWAKISDANYIEITDLENHVPDIDSIIKAACDHHAKIVYLCNPNNPTGYCFKREEIIKLLDSVPSLVVLDEAYIEFFGESSIDLVKLYPRLFVLRTLSKAFGLAGIRCGYGLGQAELINFLYKVKAPYNLNTLTQKMAIIALKNRFSLLKHLDEIKIERQKISNFLGGFKAVSCYHSGANFVYFETDYAEAIYHALLENSILIKYFKKTTTNPNSIRFSIGTPDENKKIITIIGKVLSHES